MAILAGYHVIYSYPGVQPPAELYTLISQGKVGGLILYGENVVANLSTIVQSFQDAYVQSPAFNLTKLHLLITTDQEGGEVRRLPGGPFLSEKQVGLSSDPKGNATEAGKEAAAAMIVAAVNGNLAPVLDVFRQPGNFIDEFQRSFSNDSAIVAECGAAYIAAQQAAGPVATAKHFPGLGAATVVQNTDERPVTLNVTLDELRSVDMAPYQQVIAAGVDMVMASWAVYPALDAECPSGLSSKWIQGELRERLGFRGVTITDAIESASLVAFGNEPNRAILASQAGMDLILAAALNATQGAVINDAIINALKNGSLPLGQFAESTERILKLRSKLTRQ
jgi:beta-glucosidase-like glycosyl hydrolase